MLNNSWCRHRSKTRIQLFVNARARVLHAAFALDWRCPTTNQKAPAGVERNTKRRRGGQRRKHRKSKWAAAVWLYSEQYPHNSAIISGCDVSRTFSILSVQRWHTHTHLQVPTTTAGRWITCLALCMGVHSSTVRFHDHGRAACAVAVCNNLLLTGSQNGHQSLRPTGICGCQWPVTTLGMNGKWGQLRHHIRIQWRKRRCSWSSCYCCSLTATIEASVRQKEPYRALREEGCKNRHGVLVLISFSSKKKK